MNRVFQNLVGSLKIILLGIFVRMFLTKKQLNNNIWLINEKIDEARDNGYSFFKYVREHHHDINIYYIITKESKDVEKVKRLGNVVYYGSIKHFLLYLNTDVLISSQTLPYPTGRKVSEFLYFFRLKKPKKIWLQHGITKDKLPHSGMDYDIFKYDLISCSSYKEKEFIISEYGYPRENVANVGLSRFDTLVSTVSKTTRVVVMPTFRKWLAPRNRNATETEIQEFRSSEFFKQYNSLLTELANEIDNIEIIFYAHYGLQPFLKCFDQKIKGNHKIIIAHSEEYDVQTLLRSGSLLITDYSSVFFDFAYMKKPVIYFQFDENKYRANHYNEGYFSYEKNGFGTIEQNYNDVVVQSKEYLDSGMPEKYIERVNDFFTYFDKNNSKRTFDRIMSILQ